VIAVGESDSDLASKTKNAKGYLIAPVFEGPIPHCTSLVMPIDPLAMGSLTYESIKHEKEYHKQVTFPGMTLPIFISNC
jgi:hypothetical protein